MPNMSFLILLILTKFAYLVNFCNRIPVSQNSCEYFGKAKSVELLFSLSYEAKFLEKLSFAVCEMQNCVNRVREFCEKLRM
jgi:hypothetical protein